MVKIGSTPTTSFTLELVDAATKEPFKEHTGSDGKPYVEVEPGSEYFVRIGIDGDQKVIATVAIDGERLGYDKLLYRCRSKRACCGIWYRFCPKEDGDEYEEKETSLKFSTASLTNANGSRRSTPDLWCGTVHATFFAVGEETEYIYDDFESSWTGKNPDAESPGYKKWVKSVVGTTLLVKDKDDWINTDKCYETGPELKSIEVTYCSTPGLIRAGVLTKPPLWEHAKMLYPRKDNRRGNEIPFATPERKRLRLVNDSGAVIESKEYDYFDLTGLPDDSDEDTVCTDRPVPGLLTDSDGKASPSSRRG